MCVWLLHILCVNSIRCSENLFCGLSWATGEYSLNTRKKNVYSVFFGCFMNANYVKWLTVFSESSLHFFILCPFIFYQLSIVGYWHQQQFLLNYLFFLSILSIFPSVFCVFIVRYIFSILLLSTFFGQSSL